VDTKRLLQGQKRYEHTNHLGNVLATIGDRKKPQDVTIPGDNIADYYDATLFSAQDYYPFGMEMPGRTFVLGGGYRYGFNGKEKDPTEFGSLTHYDYGFRIYNPAIGKFLSVDPLKKDYPELTPYQFASNTPIQAIDLDGLEAFFVHGTAANNSRWLQLVNNETVVRDNAKQLMRMTTNQTADFGFEWTNEKGFENGFFNSKDDRSKAANALAQYAFLNKKAGENITLIGHSHGGNVSIQAAPILRNLLDAEGLTDVKINVVTVATPAEQHVFDKEYPKLWDSNSAIDELIMVFNEFDQIQRKGANTASFVSLTTTDPFHFGRTYSGPPEKYQQYNVSNDDGAFAT
jgi:RHS repeat-associated protein